MIIRIQVGSGGWFSVTVCVNELKAKAQELKNEVKCMEDPREYKDAESLRSEQLSHVPSELALFPFPTEPRGLLSRDRNPQPDILNTYGITGNVFANSPAYSSTPYSRMLNPRDVPATGNITVQAGTEQPDAECGDRDHDTIPTPKFQSIPWRGEI